jgi:hypothetical protein
MVWANLTAKRDYTPKDVHYRKCCVKSGVTLYEGSAVVFETGATGYVTYATNTAGELFAGIATENVTGDASKMIILKITGEVDMIKASPVRADVGKEFYSDGLTNPGTVQSGTTTGCKIGKCINFDATAGTVTLDISNYS